MKPTTVLLQNGGECNAYTSSIGIYARSDSGEWFKFSNGQLYPLVDNEWPILDEEYEAMENPTELDAKQVANIATRLLAGCNMYGVTNDGVALAVDLACSIILESEKAAKLQENLDED